MKEFNKIIKKIGEELGIKVTLLSDDWLTILEKDNKIHYIQGYKFDLNNHGIGNILDDKGLFFDLLRYKKIPIIEHLVIFQDYDKKKVLDYLATKIKILTFRTSTTKTSITRMRGSTRTTKRTPMKIQKRTTTEKSTTKTMRMRNSLRRSWRSTTKNPA